MAFNAMRWIVLVGWAIYPIGFIIGNLVEISNAAPAMNAIYNLADLVNKTAFGLVIAVILQILQNTVLYIIDNQIVTMQKATAYLLQSIDKRTK